MEKKQRKQNYTAESWTEFGSGNQIRSFLVQDHAENRTSGFQGQFCNKIHDWSLLERNENVDENWNTVRNITLKPKRSCPPLLTRRRDSLFEQSNQPTREVGRWPLFLARRTKWKMVFLRRLRRLWNRHQATRLLHLLLSLFCSWKKVNSIWSKPWCEMWTGMMSNTIHVSLAHKKYQQ